MVLRTSNKIAVLIFVILVTPVSAMAQTEDWLPYTTDKFTIRYPSDWEITNVEAKSVIFKSTSQGATVTVTAVFVGNYSSAVPYLISSMKQNNGLMITEMDNNSYFLSNNPATRVIGSLTSSPGVDTEILSLRIQK